MNFFDSGYLEKFLDNSFQVPFLDFEFDLPTIKLRNLDVGVGTNLDIEEHYDEGKFTLKFSFPEEYYPQVLNYNR